MDNEAPLPEHPLILSLDTSSSRTSVAVARGERVIAIFGAELDERRSERLWREVEFVVNEAGVSLSDIDLFTCCTGPGGFTGLRVGLAAIKGFATAGRKRVVGVTTLEALASSAGVEGAVLALVNATRREFYSQLFACKAAALPQADAEPFIGTPEKIAARLLHIENLILVGEGADLLLEEARVLESNEGSSAGRVTASWALKSAPQFLAYYIARIALLKLDRGETVAPGELRACYVRPADAELKLSLGLVGRGLQ